MKQFLYQSPVGKIFLVTSNKGLRGLYWEKQSIEFATRPDGIATQVIGELDEYFKGQRQSFTVPLDLEGTSFQKKVWKELLTIPYGETCSYKDIAKKIASEKSSRAVGTANGRNPLCIVIPCHRVVTNSGGIGGYSGGILKKKKLLKLEEATRLS